MKIQRILWQQMLDHVSACLHEEACGILGGRGEIVEVVIPVANELHSPDRFRMAPEEQLKAILNLEKSDLEMIGIFHSHPKGPGEPSLVDLEEFAYPGVRLIILYPGGDEWAGRGFYIDQRSFIETKINIE